MARKTKTFISTLLQFAGTKYKELNLQYNLPHTYQATWRFTTLGLPREASSSRGFAVACRKVLPSNRIPTSAHHTALVRRLQKAVRRLDRCCYQKLERQRSPTNPVHLTADHEHIGCMASTLRVLRTSRKTYSVRVPLTFKKKNYCYIFAVCRGRSHRMNSHSMHE